ncbi:hypothetical protein HPB49_007652 [Dermacentor silvarum]|uniref:Uncharacterized protein n=1 Tax=Dermacentor silvarum TaxID=543639 RepID=A0ACB8C852_DERSI|nr:hypothetical protein HPB49_007652 [Dermacentor silvarum]
MANGDERNAYNERLIDAVQHERRLWNLRDRNYKSRPVCDAAWRHVAAVIRSTAAEVKARWKNLRDTFRPVLKDWTRASKSGAAADHVLDESTRWVFFSRLMFLKIQCTGGPQQTVEGIYTEKEVSTSEPTEPLEALTAESCGDVSARPPPPKRKPRRSKYEEEIEGLSKFITETPDEHERFVYGRQISLASATSLWLPCDTDALRELVRSVVPEELDRLQGVRFQPTVTSLTDIVREEVHQAAQPFMQTRPEAAPVLTYAQAVRLPAQPVNNRNPLS